MEKLRITMFGVFSISCGDIVVSESDNRSRKVWNLIKYLVANRERRLTYEEIGEAVGIRESASSASAIKTMLHRARNTLIFSNFPESQNLIVQSGGRCFWNTDIAQTIDEDLFVKYINDANHASHDTAGSEMKLAALGLYKGYYLNRALDTIPCVAEKIQEYHIMAISAFESAAEYMLAEKPCDLLYDLSLKMMQIDPYQEAFHYYLLKTSIELGKNELALVYYNRVIELLADRFKVGPSERIKALYRCIIRGGCPAKGDVASVRDELLSNAQNTANYCDYHAFLLLYRMLYGSAPEIKSSIRLVLFSVEPKSEASEPGEMQLKRAHTELKEIIGQILPEGDAYTEYSDTQYIALVNVSGDSKLDKLISGVQSAFCALDNMRTLYLDISHTELFLTK